MAKKSEIQLPTLIAGVLTALVIVIMQVFYFQTAGHPIKKEINTDQQQEEHSGDEAYISLPSSTLPSAAVHVELQQESFYLFEILFNDEQVEEKDCSISTLPGKLFQTLFRVIISPNAP